MSGELSSRRTKVASNGHMPSGKLMRDVGVAGLVPQRQEHGGALPANSAAMHVNESGHARQVSMHENLQACSGSSWAVAMSAPMMRVLKLPTVSILGRFGKEIAHSQWTN